MHKNLFWLAFLTIVAICVLGYTGFTFYELYQYQRLTKQTTPKNISWTVLNLSDDAFVPQATYEFIFDGVSYKGKTTWNEHYLNAWTAKEEIDRETARKIKVWFDPSNPKYSSLQKNFPFKYSLYTIMLWLLLLYFIGLGRYINTRI